MATAARWLDPWRQPAATAAIWRALADACRPSYFLRWPWVETWLRSLPRDLELRLIVREDDAGPLAAWFLGRRLVRRGGVLPSRALFLNATGADEYDELTIEHNAWLVRPGARCDLADVLAAIPTDWAWDELELTAMDAAPAALVPPPPARRAPPRVVACPTVDLARVRAADDYVSLLGPDVRAQIRRARKLYEKRGPLRVEIAAERARAWAIFDELRALHAATWRGRGRVGAFTPYLTRFHDRLIDARLPHGEIQLARVTVGDATIGCLYNFVQDGVVSYYQSGLVYEADNRLKPGLVCHAAVIAECARLGHATYDFLAGDSRYKRSLATTHGELAWVTVERPSVRVAALTGARGLRAWWRARRG